MTAVRINKKSKNFVILDKTCLQNSTLSWEAKGLHTYLLSLPDDWDVAVSDLKNRASNGRDSVRRILNELIDAGFISKEWIKNTNTRTFSRLEYTVHETPIAVSKENDENNNFTPSPENQFSASLNQFDKNQDINIELEAKKLETVFQGTANQAPKKAIQIINNINNNKNKINNKTAAINNCDINQPLAQVTKNFAAAVFEKNLQKENQNQNLLKPTEQDALIAGALTPYQELQVHNLTKTLSTQMHLPCLSTLALEIKYCLLNAKHFTACGKDFNKKLNAMRKVILRGDWTTPVGFSVKAPTLENPEVLQLQKSLNEAIADKTHFQKMLSKATNSAKSSIEEIINKAQQKIKELEMKINQTLTNTAQYA